MQHVWGQESCIQGFRRGRMMEKDHLEDLGVDGRKILKLIFKKWNGKAWYGFLWLRTRTGSGRL